MPKTYYPTVNSAPTKLEDLFSEFRKTYGSKPKEPNRPAEPTYYTPPNLNMKDVQNILLSEVDSPDDSSEIPTSFKTQEVDDELRIDPNDLSRIFLGRKEKLNEKLNEYKQKESAYKLDLESYKKELSDFEEKVKSPDIDIDNLPFEAIDRFKQLTSMAYESAASEAGYGKANTIPNEAVLKEGFKQRLGNLYPLFEKVKAENDFGKKVISDFGISEQNLNEVLKLKREADQAIRQGKDKALIEKRFMDVLNSFKGQ